MDTSKYTPGLVVVGTLGGAYVMSAAGLPAVLPTALFGAAALVSINNKHPWWALFFLIGAAANATAPAMIAQAKAMKEANDLALAQNQAKPATPPFIATPAT